jgi:type IV secretion system protein VirB8
MNAEPELEAYWAEAASWDADRVRMASRSSRRAWWVAAAGWSCAVMGLGALIFLMPLKRVEAFVVRVDNSTGIIDVVPTFTKEADPAEVVSRYLLTHYVTVCERFNFATAESDYEECGAFHNAQRNAAWYALWNPTNPASPLNTYKDGTTVRSRVTSVSFFRRGNGLSDLAQVRYVKASRRAGATQEEMTHWIASVQFAYGEPSKDAKTRAWNPLGFKILDFHPEPEILQEASVAAPTGPEPASRRIQP